MMEYLGALLFFIFCVSAGGLIGGWIHDRRKKPKALTKSQIRDVVARQSFEGQVNHGAEPFDGMPETPKVLDFYTWLDFAIKQLRRRWGWISYESAGRWVQNELECYGHAYPDPSVSWDRSSAEETANEIADNYGEEFGSNQ